MLTNLCNRFVVKRSSPPWWQCVTVKSVCKGRDGRRESCQTLPPEATAISLYTSGSLVSVILEEEKVVFQQNQHTHTHI